MDILVSKINLLLSINSVRVSSAPILFYSSANLDCIIIKSIHYDAYNSFGA